MAQFEQLLKSRRAPVVLWGQEMAGHPISVRKHKKSLSDIDCEDATVSNSKLILKLLVHAAPSLLQAGPSRAE